MNKKLEFRTAHFEALIGFFEHNTYANILQYKKNILIKIKCINFLQLYRTIKTK